MVYQPADSRLIHAEIINFDRLRTLNNGGSQRCDFLVVGFIESGRGRIRVDFRDYPLAAGDVAWIAPGSVHQWRDFDQLNGRILLCPTTSPLTTATRLKASSPRHPALVTPTASERPFIVECLDHLAHETDPDAPQHPTDVEAALLTALIARVPDDPSEQRRDARFARFQDLLEVDFRAYRDVAHYADRLHVTSRTLTRSALTSTGLPARRVIEERVVLEAKRLLLHHGLSSAACAAELGFDDPSAFSSYFARVAGLRPGAWRDGQTTD